MKNLIYLITLLTFFSCSREEYISKISNEHILIEGSNIFLKRPTWMFRSEKFKGLKTKDGFGTIKVETVSLDYKDVLEQYSKAMLSRNRMTIDEETKINFNGSPATYLFVIQKPRYGNADFRKHILLVDLEKGKTMIIRGSYPLNTSNQLYPKIKDIVFSAYYENDEEVVIEASGTFSVDPSGTNLKLASNIMGSLTYTIDGNMPLDTADKTKFIVAKSFSSQFGYSPNRIEGYAEKRFKQLPNGNITEVESKKTVRINGLNGYEIYGYHPIENGNKKLIFQTMLFSDYVYYIMGGSAEQDFEKNIETFQRIASTFKRS